MIIDNFVNYKYLFHKYLLKITNPQKRIEYLKINEIITNPIRKYILHIHCYDLKYFEKYFTTIFDNYNNLFDIIITYCEGEILDLKNNYNIIWLKIVNKGADIGGKICAINYLNSSKVEYSHILFVHSKTDQSDRENFLKPFESRAKLIIGLIENSNFPIDAIFPNYHNIVYDEKNNTHTIKYNLKYLNDFLLWLGINYNPKKINYFNGTNTFIFSKRLIDFIFGDEKLLTIYNTLNESNTFDYCWYRKKYNIKEKDIFKVFEDYQTKGNIGNCFNDLTKSLPNCCVEHMFERAWINIITHLGYNYLCLPTEKIFDYYKIKLNAIYFPQYHNSPENNKFWGDGFTEWTLLKPYPDKITINQTDIPILKPHSDIGYYSLDSIDTFKSQCAIANTYGLSGFVIYHYWFGNSHSVLNKVEKHILSGQIDYKFCFSWANEPWTKRWDGLNNSVLIAQDYEDEDNFTHIDYLIKFFKLPNYIKTENGECIFYIYNFHHIRKHFEKIKKKWKMRLSEQRLKIKFISTSNAVGYNKNHGSNIKFDFIPMSLTKYWKSYSNSNSISNINQLVDKITQHWELDYDNVISYIDKVELTTSHIGLCGRWNNIVRRQGIGGHLHITNYTSDKFDKLLMRLIVKIILKQINKFETKEILKYNVKKIINNNLNYNIDECVIIINAWNEWNEQAVIEPTNYEGYINLEIIKYYYNL